MLRLIVLAVVVVAAHSIPLLGGWEDFKRFHGKEYDSIEEDNARREIFEQNLKIIIKHNKEAEQGLHTYTLGTNEYADWSSKEFVDVMNGFANKQSIFKSSKTHSTKSEADPTTVDWRDKGYVTGVKNQKQCGSCWAFSATGSLEGQHFKTTGNLVSLSEQNLVDCSRPEGNMGCEGGLMDQAFEYIKLNGGIDTEMSYPYTAMDGTQCMFNPNNVGATDTGFMDIASGDEMALRNAVATVGPISVAIDASKQTFQLYQSGVYSDPTCSSTQLDHGVLAVGYGNDQMSGQDYWLVKNSWGMTWGMQGYIKMARNMNNMCGIATSASYPLV